MNVREKVVSAEMKKFDERRMKKQKEREDKSQNKTEGLK